MVTMSETKVIKDLNKKYGDNTVTTLGNASFDTVEVVPTGISSLDYILGVGGLPLGKIVEVFGLPQSGKSTMCYNTIAAAQKMGLKCAYIDAEHAMDKGYMKRLGITDDLIVNSPLSGEEGLTVLFNLVKDGDAQVVVLDSVASLAPNQVLESEIGDCNVASLARLMTPTIVKLTGIAAKNNCLVIFINQIRYKIGGYGNPETTPGGNSLKHHASIRLNVRAGKPIKKGENIIGMNTRVTVAKNKLAVPYKKTEFDLILGEGIDKFKDTALTAKLTGVIEFKGAWVYMDGEQVCQGLDAFTDLIRTDTELYDKVQAAILTKE